MVEHAGVAGADQRPRDLFRDPEFIALAAVKFVSAMAFATIIIALALYADIFKASGIVAGLFGTAYALVRLTMVLPLGRMIDIGNSKRYLLLGLALNVILLIGYILVQAVEHVILLRGFQAIGSIILWVTGLAVVGELAPDDNRGMWIGTYNQVRAVASLAGDIVGGALLFVAGFTVTYSVLILLSAVATILVFVFLRDDPGTRSDPGAATGIETYLNLLRRRVILSLVVFRFSFSFGKMAVILFLPIFARTEFGMSALLIGGILAGGKLMKALTQGVIGQLADRTGGLEWYVFVGTIGYAIGTVLIPFAVYADRFISSLSLPGGITLVPAFFALFAAYSILGIADSLRLPTSMALFVQEGQHYDAVAGSLSLRSVSWQVGAIFGPIAVGAMFDHVSYFGGFWLAGVFMLLAGMIFLWLYDAEVPPAAGAGTPTVGDD